jgi:cell division protein FtsB
MFKKISVIVIIIVAIGILIGLVKQISSALGSDKRLNLLLEDVGMLERENKQLKKELSQAESYDSVEEIARNDLNMSLPNETVVIIPRDMIEKVLTPEVEPVEVKTPNWQGWLKLFTQR